MIIYFADRNLNITGLASTSLPSGFRIADDMLTEDVETGVNTFEFKVSYNDGSRQELEQTVTVGTYILKGGGNAFDEEVNSYDALYQIVETEFDTLSYELSVYAEDAGLDLLNTVVPAANYSSKTLSQMLTATVPAGWTLNLIGTPSGQKSVNYDGESSCTERVDSIANLFGCEVYYSFVIERFAITAKVLNVIPKRGDQDAKIQLRLNQDINRIVTKSSIADLATAFTVTGGTPDGSNTPVNLVGYSYTYTDPNTGDVYKVDTSTGQMRNTSAMKRWASVLDSDGLLIRQYSFDTTNKATLAGQARAELQKQSAVAVEYEVDFVSLRGAKIGDRVNIIDEQGELFLEARLLQVKTSVTAMTQTATIGEYKLKSSGIADMIKAYAADFAANVKNGLDGIVLSVISSGGNTFHNTPISTTLTATVFYGPDAITNQTDLESAFGAGAAIKWYNYGGTLLGTGFSYVLTSAQNKEVITAKLET